MIRYSASSQTLFPTTPAIACRCGGMASTIHRKMESRYSSFGGNNSLVLTGTLIWKVPGTRPQLSVLGVATTAEPESATTIWGGGGALVPEAFVSCRTMTVKFCPF